MKQAFIYKWVDSKSGMSYIGRHVGHVDDGYIGSGTVFSKEYNSRPADFSREILFLSEYIDDTSIKLEEEKILSTISSEELFRGANPKYYNQVKNSHGFTCTDNPMLHADLIDQMKSTRKENGCKNAWENTIAKYGIDEWTRMNSENKKGNTFGSANKDIAKSTQHKDNISESITKMYDAKRHAGVKLLGGRKRDTPYEEIVQSVKEIGFAGSANKYGLTVAALKGRYYNAVKALKKSQ